MGAVGGRPAGALLVLLLMLLAACTAGSPGAGQQDDAEAMAADVSGTGAGPTAPEDPPQRLTTDDPAVRDAVLLTAVDEVLAGTAHVDLVDEDPGAFLETPVTLCGALEEGASPDMVLSEFLTTLRDEGLEFGEDSAYLAGALLGASVAVRCPEHEDAVAEVQP